VPLAACGGSASGAPPVALLESIRAQPARVTFEFRTAPRQIKARYVPKAQVAEAGSGLPVAVKGKAFLVVHFIPASGADLSGSTFKLVYRGPKRLKPASAGPVQELARVSDFEADLGWVIGLDRRRPVHVARAGANVIVRVG